MNILSNHNISNSLKINSKCKFFIEINEVTQFEDLYKFVNEQKLPVLVLGEGTNIVPKDYFEGIVIKPIFKKVQYNTNDSTVSVGSSVSLVTTIPIGASGGSVSSSWSDPYNVGIL